MKIWLGLIAVFIASGSVAAGNRSYQCQIKEYFHLSADGALVRPPEPYLLDRRFAVDRQTGVLTGDVGFAFEGTGYRVLASGNSESSFISTFSSVAAGNGLHFVFVRIQEFEQGKHKPFVILDGGSVVSGICE